MKRFIPNFVWLGAFAGIAAQGAGFEKATLWGARSQGVAGAVTSTTSGAEALFFNPAGLASGGAMGDAALELSPTFARSKAPILADNTVVEGERVTIVPFALMGRYVISPELSVGAGLYAAGGFGADFGALDVSTATGVTSVKPRYDSKIQVVELGAGVGYRVMPGLSVGLGWRASFVSAEFHMPQVGSTSGLATVTEISLEDLSDVNVAGIRMGAQYRPEGQGWGVGVGLRTPISFTAVGQASGKLGIQGVAEASDLEGSEASVKNTLPMQWLIGADFDVMPGLKVVAQYDFTNYSKNKTLDITGTLTTTQGDVELTDIAQNWKNMHQFRVGAEYAVMENVVARVGYLHTSQVTPNAYARPNFFSPGAGNTFTLGGGTTIMDGALDIDGAIEYARDTGDVTEPAETTIKKGTYTASATTVHIGAAYRF